MWFANCRHTFYFPQKKRHVQKKKKQWAQIIKTCSPAYNRQMYFVHLYSLHVYCAVVDLDSSGSPGVCPTPGLTSSTQVVCVCVRAYTNTHTHTTLTPAKIEKYTRQNPYLYPCPNIASHASNKRQPWTSWKKPHFQSPHTHACGCQETPVIYAHAVENLDSTNEPNVPTRLHMYTHTRVYINVYAYIYTDIHTYTYAHIHMHIYTHTCTHIYICMHMHTYAQIKNLSIDASTCQAIS